MGASIAGSKDLSKCAAGVVACMVTIQQALQAGNATPDELTLILDVLAHDGLTRDKPAGQAFTLLDVEVQGHTQQVSAQAHPHCSARIRRWCRCAGLLVVARHVSRWPDRQQSWCRVGALWLFLILRAEQGALVVVDRATHGPSV